MAARVPHRVDVARDEPHRLLGVVRRAERLDAEAADRDGLTRRQHVRRRAREEVRRAAQRARRRVHRPAPALQRGRDARDVIAVLVRDQQRRDRLRRDADLPQELRDASRREADVHQHAGLAALHEHGVPLAAAA
jgi:hypothetical protein